MFRFFASLFVGIATLVSGITHPSSSGNISPTGGQATISTQQVVLSQEELLSMAGNIYANGNVPLGDKKYVTDNPKKGYIYFCNIPQSGGGGAENSGTWLTVSTWNPSEKPTVAGKVYWPNAKFGNTISGDTRLLTGNGLPVGITTGTFPIAATDPAYQYDKNPNTIQTQSLSLSLPASPTYAEKAHCMGMEVGVMLDGVPLFNGFDAELRDAPAREIQDSCNGHPQMNGEYHYHSLSSCFSDTSVSTVLGFALDGFPITGNKVASGKYLTTENLDECHGITSEIILDGRQVTMYHYVMTEDFPYSVSCFRGKPVSYQVLASGQSKQNGQMGNRQQNVPMPSSIQQAGQHPMMRPMPPTGAFTACSDQTTGASCTFTTPNGTISGTCQNPNGSQMVCVPQMPGGQQGRPMNY